VKHVTIKKEKGSAGKHFWSAETLIDGPPWCLTRLVSAVLILDDAQK
jgi:hypothetical protein